MGTISGNSYTLTSANNPVYVTGTIGGSGVALYGPGNPGTTNSWTITNSGTIVGSGSSGIGVRLGTTGNLVAPSRINNTSSGSITGYSFGIEIFGAATIGNAGYIEGSTAIKILGGAGTVGNAGTIIGANGGGAAGVYLGSGGSVGNTGTAALIQGKGSAAGVVIGNAAGTVSNAGTISGASGAGVLLTAGGSVDNTGTAALIQTQGDNAVSIPGNAGTVRNSGTITTTAAADGANLAAGGSVDNQAGGFIHGRSAGVYIHGGGGTVTNAGTISAATGGTPGSSVRFTGTGNNLLILEHGYALVGGVSLAGTSNVLQLLGTAGAVTVDFDKVGAGFTQFGTVSFGAPSGNAEILKITDTTALPQLIFGFDGPSDVIDLTTIGTDGHITNIDAGNHRVTVTGSAGAATLQFDPTANLAAFTTQSDGLSGIDVVACFCRGTMILTANGETLVEELAIGDLVMTLSREARPIRWIGRRAYDGRFIAGNRKALPIRIAAGALGDGVPKRELWVSPGHSLYIGDALVRSEHLLNGVTIVQAERVDHVEYFHIEFDSHDVIFADGAPAESYVECDNRSRFANAAEYAALYPDDDRLGWSFCAPCLAWGSPELVAIRAALLLRAAQAGHVCGNDPELRLAADGAAIAFEKLSSRHYRVAVPAGSRDVRLVSLTSVPAAIDAATLDLRLLGVAVEKLVLSGAHLRIEIDHGHPLLGEGFHEDEETLRWTAGNGLVPEALLRPFPDGCTLEARLVDTDLRYWTSPTAAAVA